ncbi:hypothetical protein CKAN_02560000 [Cinnamomum micranthum f. kanehirae]|uniref:RING-type E3 ubiquitin transferase n=1 Tax=Cinnamomum micranthum f. kanehirae TaxID=337451 RepID=A0A3S3NBQ8_9MAGN|nr:hypothetical protein CKAN_02560000 [Cinnamomum micranthum f. kanehirae]
MPRWCVDRPLGNHSARRLHAEVHCNSIVEESTSNGHELPLGFLYLEGGYYKGGQKFLSNQTPNYLRSAYFYTESLSETDTEGVLKVQASLGFIDGQIYQLPKNSTILKSRHHGQQGFRDGREGSIRFEMQGFWSESTGKLCMVGTGQGLSEEGDDIQLSAVTKINYPKRSDIHTSIVTGTVESIDSEDSSSYFNPVSVLGFSQKTYSYSMATEIEGMCGGGDYKGEESLRLEPHMSVCYMLMLLESTVFQLNYGSNSSAGKCSPFDGLLHHHMSVGGYKCSNDGKMRMFLRFSNLSSYWKGVTLIPETVLVAEGVWDEEKNQLCMVGCPLKNFEGSLAETRVGDCSVGLSLTFPKVWSLKMRSPALGSIWSLRKSNESDYFDRIGFRSLSGPILVSDLKYNYTESGQVKNSCADKDMKRNSGKRFPDGSSFIGMRFDMSLKTKSRRASGSATPLSIGQVFFVQYTPHSFASSSNSVSKFTAPVSHNLLNVSYSIYISFRDNNTSEVTRISAEGIYDAETGTLCMVGCRSLAFNGEKAVKNTTLDCKILININLAPYNSKAGEKLKGTIRSTREMKDPLHFDELELSSHDIYGVEAKQTISRMDLEITMVLISLTLACLFIGLQLYYVKKHPDVLPSISIVMLVVLTLGHMIPLVLNFEAFSFRDHKQQNLTLWSGGLLEANEVLVRVITMVAFLLQFRLLQLTLSARFAESSKKNLWDAEKKASLVCLLLYLFGGLILMNLFWDSKDKALAPSYYGGTTIVRSLPHAYDAYRAHKSLPHVNSTYFYAEPGWDLYSAIWDVIIPCGGLLFAFLIFLQQMFGGAFILQRRFRQSAEYEKAPVVGG